jgi:hypothetical protein
MINSPQLPQKSLLSLPPELILEICSYIDDADRISLSLIHPRFYRMVDFPSTECTKRVIQQQFLKTLLPRFNCNGCGFLSKSRETSSQWLPKTFNMIYIYNPQYPKHDFLVEEQLLPWEYRYKHPGTETRRDSVRRHRCSRLQCKSYPITWKPMNALITDSPKLIRWCLHCQSATGYIRSHYLKHHWTGSPWSGCKCPGGDGCTSCGVTVARSMTIWQETLPYTRTIVEEVKDRDSAWL